MHLRWPAISLHLTERSRRWWVVSVIWFNLLLTQLRAMNKLDTWCLLCMATMRKLIMRALSVQEFFVQFQGNEMLLTMIIFLAFTRSGDMYSVQRSAFFPFPSAKMHQRCSLTHNHLPPCKENCPNMYICNVCYVECYFVQRGLRAETLRWPLVSCPTR